MVNYDYVGSWLWLWDTNNSQTIFTFLLIACVILYLFFFSINKHLEEAGLPPGPRGVPLLGYLPFLKPDLHRELAKLSVTYGPIYKIWLGKKLWIVISSPSIAKEVVRDQDLIFANRDLTVASLALTSGGSDIAFAEYGEYWRKMRKIFVQEMMSNSSLGACSNLRRLEVRKTIKSLYNNNNKVVGAGEGAGAQGVDIGDLALRLMVNATMAMVWGRSFVDDQGLGTRMESEFRNVVSQMMVVLGQTNVSDFIPSLACFDLHGVKKRAEKIRKWLHSIFDSIIERAVAERAGDKNAAKQEEEATGDGQKKDILQILLDLQLTDKNFGNMELKAILIDIIIGGTDTTATTIEWVMSRLLYHPQVMEKVVEELTRVVGSENMVDELHLSNLNYLDAVLKETFRLNPPIPLLLPKSSREKTTLCGYNISKGTTVFVNMWAIQRDPQLWDNPEEFRPERFFNNPATFDFYGNNFQFMPFGSGRRICPGIPLAEKMAKYVLASLLHSFHWELPQGAELELEDRFGIVLKKSNPLIAIPKPRLSNSHIYI